MAIGEPHAGGNNYSVKPKNLKPGQSEYPTLDLEQKTGNGYEVVNQASYLTGFITHIEKVDRTHEKYGRFRGVKFTMMDPDANEKYFWELLYSGPTRELLNRFASLGSFADKLKISFYRGDKGYCGASVKKFGLSGEEKVEIKYGYKEFLEPRIKIVHFQGKDQKDYTMVDDFFDGLIEKVLIGYSKPNFTGSYIPATPVAEQYRDEDAIPAITQTNEPSNDNKWKDDLPF